MHIEVNGRSPGLHVIHLFLIMDTSSIIILHIPPPSCHAAISQNTTQAVDCGEDSKVSGVPPV